MKDIFVIVPTLNPNVELLENCLKELKKEFDNILLFDDGCDKEYSSVFDKWEKKGVIVLHHYKNLGKGRALKDAFNYLLVRYPNLKGVVTCDSDGQHQPKDVKKCAKLILDNPEKLILGCRNFDLPHVPRKNRFGNKTTRGVFKLFLGLKITDTQTGLRAFPVKVMSKFLDTPGERFEYENNMLIDTISKDVEILEEEIETVYLENSNKESHFHPIKDSYRIYKTFFKYILSSLSAFLIDISLFSLFNFLLGTGYILIATIFARIISSFFNFLINKKIVFKNKSNVAVYRYFILVIVQMLVSGCVTTILDNILLWNTILIKLVVDSIIFIVNFVIQREFVFKDANEKNN